MEHLRVYRILPAADADAAEKAGVFLGSALDQQHGFIHLSGAHQVRGTLARYFAGRQDLVLLAIETASLGDLRWEISRDDMLFPHLYENLPWSAVVARWPITVGEDGTATLPAEIA